MSGICRADPRVLLIHVELQNSNVLWDPVSTLIASGYVPRLYSLNYPTLAKDLPPDLKPASLGQLQLADPMANTVTEKLIFLRDFCTLVSQRSSTDPKKQGKQGIASLQDTSLIPEYIVVLVSNFHFYAHYSSTNSATITSQIDNIDYQLPINNAKDNDAPDVILQQKGPSRIQPHEQFALDCARTGVCFGGVFVLHEDMDSTWTSDANFRDLLLKLGIPVNYVRGAPPFTINYNLFTYKYRHCDADIRIRTVPFFHIRNQGKYTQYYIAYSKHEKITIIPAKDEKAFLTKVKDSFNEQLIACSIIQKDLLRTINTLLLSPRFYHRWLIDNNVSYLSDIDFCAEGYYRQKNAQGLKHIRYRKINKTILPTESVYTFPCQGDGVKGQQKTGKDQKEIPDMVVLPTLENFFEDKLLVLSRMHNGTFMNELFSNDICARIGITSHDSEPACEPLPPQKYGNKQLYDTPYVDKIYNNIFSTDFPKETPVEHSKQNKQSILISFLLSGYLNDISKMPVFDQNRVSVVMECMLRQFSALDDLILKKHEQKQQEREALAEEQAIVTRTKSNNAQRSGSKASSSAGTSAGAHLSSETQAGTEIDRPNFNTIVQQLATQSLEENRFNIKPVDTMLLSTELGEKVPSVYNTHEPIGSSVETDTQSADQIDSYFSSKINVPMSLHTEPLKAMLETSITNRQELISISSAIISAATTGVTSLQLHTLQKLDNEQEINSNKLAPSLLNAFFGIMPHKLTTTYESIVKVSGEFIFQVENYVETESLEREKHINDIRLKAASYDLLAIISLLNRLKELQTVKSDHTSCKEDYSEPTVENEALQGFEEIDGEVVVEKPEQIDYYQMHVKESSVPPVTKDIKGSFLDSGTQYDKSCDVPIDATINISFGAVMMEFLHKDLDYTTILDTLSSISTYSIITDTDNKSITLAITSDVAPLKQNQAHLLAQFKNDMFSLFNTVPMFNVWINTPLVQSVLADESFLSNNYSQIWTEYYTDIQVEQRSKSTQQAKHKDDKQSQVPKQDVSEIIKDQRSSIEHIPLLPAIIPLTKRYRIPGDRLSSPQAGNSMLYDQGSTIEQSVMETQPQVQAQASSLKNVALPRDTRADKTSSGKQKDSSTKTISPLREVSCANSSNVIDDKHESSSLNEYARPIFPLPSEFVDTSTISPPTHMFLGSTGNFLNSNLVISECFGSVGLMSNYCTKLNERTQCDEGEECAEKLEEEQSQPPDPTVYVPNRLLATYIQEPEQVQLLEDDDKKKTLPMLLDTTLLPDFDININTVATQFDLRSADTSAYVAQYTTGGSMHCIESIPASGVICHKIINGSGLNIRISLRPIELSSVVVGHISTPFSPTPEVDIQYAERCIERMIHESSKPCTADSSMQRSAGAAKTKKDRERESLQQIEWRRRKRKLAELKALVDEEKARRESSLPAPGTPVLGIRPLSSYLHMILSSRNMHVTYIGNKVLIKYGYDLLLFLYIGQQRVKLTKIFLNVDLNTLEVSADSDPWLSLLYEFKQHYTGRTTQFPIIRLSYELRRSIVRLYAEFPTSHYAMYIELDENGNLEEDAASILSTALHDSATTSMLRPTEKTFSIPDALDGVDISKSGTSDLQATSPQQIENLDSKNITHDTQDVSVDDESNLYDDVIRKEAFIAQTDRLSRQFSTSFLIIFTCPTSSFYTPFKEEVLKEPPMPCTSTKILNKGSIYYAKGIHARVTDLHDSVTNHELTTINLSTMIPYIFTSDRVMLHYCHFKNIMAIAHLSDHLLHRDVVDILRTSKDMTDLNSKNWFEIIVSNIFTIDKQIIHEDPSRFVKALKRLCIDDTRTSIEAPSVFVQLPVGLMAIFDEHDRMALTYSSESGMDTISISPDGSIQVTFGDVLRTGFFYHGSDYYASVCTEADKALDISVAINGNTPGVFTYRLTTKPELNSETISILAGYPRPGMQFRTIGRDPYQFLPNIWNIFRKDEKLPRSLVHFTPGIAQMVPTGDNTEIDKESVLHLGSSLPGPCLLGFQFVIDTDEHSVCCANSVTATLRLLRTDSEHELKGELHRLAANDIYLNIVQPLISCTNPLQRAVANYSLPDYTKNIIFNKYDFTIQQSDKESHTSSRANSEKIFLDSNKVVSGSDGVSMQEDIEEKSSNELSKKETEEPVHENKSEKFGSDIGHSSLMADIKDALEDGQSTIPYLDGDDTDSTTAEEQHTGELVESIEDDNYIVPDSQMKVDFLRKGLTNLFWDSEEGQAYLTGGLEGYQDCVNKYHNLAETVLGKEMVSEYERLPSRSIHKCVEKHLKAITLPRSLPPPYSKREDPELPVLPTEEELVARNSFTRPLNQVETNKSIRNQLYTVATETMHAAACSNITFAAREDLRKITIPTTYKIPYTRHVLVTPTKVRLGSMLAPADLTTARICFKNTGHMPVRLRYDLVHTENDVPKEERIIVDVCMTLNKGGIPPGMTTTVMMKIRTPIQSGHFSTVAFFKTEEEVIAIPIEGVVQSGSPRSTLNKPHARSEQSQILQINTINNIDNNINNKAHILQNTMSAKIYQDDDSSDEE